MDFPKPGMNSSEIKAELASPRAPQLYQLASITQSLGLFYPGQTFRGVPIGEIPDELTISSENTIALFTEHSENIRGVHWALRAVQSKDFHCKYFLNY